MASTLTVPREEMTTAPAPRPETDTSGPARRAVSLLAVVLLLVGVAAAWPGASDGARVVAAVLIIVTVALLVLAVLAVCAPDRMLRRVDVGVLVVGVVGVGAPALQTLHDGNRRYPSDEGRLVQLATGALARGHDPYSMRWPSVAQFAGNTPLLGGGGVTRFGYPPLSAEVGAALGRVWAPLGTPGAVGALGLLATAILCFVLMPVRWRALAVAVTLGLGPLTTWAVNGHPAMLALPLLCAACRRWTRLGIGGRLGATGIVQAVCLGLAAAAQQLAWFVALGLVVALWMLRRDTRLVARYVAIAGGAFVVMNAPFLVTAPGAWLGGVTSVLTQHAVAGGQGLVALSTVLRGEAGDLGYYALAAGLLLLGVLVIVAVAFGRVAPAVPLLVLLTFLVTTRSPAEYFLVLAPVWLVWLFGTDPQVVAAAPSWRRLHAPRAQAVAAVVALLPAAAAVVVAVAQPGPLALHVADQQRARGRIQSLTVLATNRTDDAVRPSFYLDPRSHLRSAWRIAAGPRSLAPHAHATYRLVPGPLGPEVPTPDLRVWALSDAPPAMSSTALS